MRRDPVPEGDEDPLDVAFGEVHDLADLEQRFALLDARIGTDEFRAAHAPGDEVAGDDDDPFSDIARALREQRAQLGADDDADADDHSDTSLADHDEASDDDPVAMEIEDRCQEALDALELDEPARARELALEAVRLDDEHPFPMFVLGLVAEQEGDLDTARDMAELSLRTAGTNPDAIGLRAHIHVRQHEFAEAEHLLRFGIAHNPDEATLHEGLARVALAQGHHEDALQAATSALRIEPGNPGAMAVRTAALEEGGDRGALLAALRQGVQLHPEDPYSMVELASVEMEHGNLERARMLLMRAQRLAPRDSDIGDVRALIEHVHERPLLRPVPALLRWMRDFPGGLAGFLVGFVVAALPLHALATMSTTYRIPALAIVAAWGAIALYAWIAPSILTHRLNQRAARGAADRLLQELRDPLATMPSLNRIGDVASMLLAAHDRRGAAELLALAARRFEIFGARPLAPDAVTAAEASVPIARQAARLRGPVARVRAVLLAIPGMPRILVAVAVGIAVAAPVLDLHTQLPLLAWHGVAVACMVTAWLLLLVERAAIRDLDDAFTALRLEISSPASSSRG